RRSRLPSDTERVARRPAGAVEPGGNRATGAPEPARAVVDRNGEQRGSGRGGAGPVVRVGLDGKRLISPPLGRRRRPRITRPTTDPARVPYLPDGGAARHRPVGHPGRRYPLPD